MRARRFPPGSSRGVPQRLCRVGLWLVLAASGCASAEKTGPYAHYETLLEILADLQRHAGDDLYRFPTPTDPSGQNLYKAVLTRLDNYRRVYPARFPAEVTFCRARAFARLRDYTQAERLYQLVIASSQAAPEIQQRARQNADLLRKMLAVRPPERPPGRPAADVLEELDLWIDSWKAVLGRMRGTHLESLAAVELEAAQEARLAFVARHRRDLRDGTSLALRTAEAMIATHAESHRIGDHLLAAGDLHMELARDYILANPPASGQFSAARFDRLMRGAIRIYSGVASMDGAVQKPQGQGKLLAAEAFARRVRRLAE